MSTTQNLPADIKPYSTKHVNWALDIAHEALESGKGKPLARERLTGLLDIVRGDDALRITNILGCF